jgi:hypothetical protein
LFPLRQPAGGQYKIPGHPIVVIPGVAADQPATCGGGSGLGRRVALPVDASADMITSAAPEVLAGLNTAMRRASQRGTSSTSTALPISLTQFRDCSTSRNRRRRDLDFDLLSADREMELGSALGSANPFIAGLGGSRLT